MTDTRVWPELHYALTQTKTAVDQVHCSAC